MRVLPQSSLAPRSEPVKHTVLIQVVLKVKVSGSIQRRLLHRELSLRGSRIDTLLGNHRVSEGHASQGVLITTGIALLQKVSGERLAAHCILSTHSARVQIISWREVHMRVDAAKAVVGDGLVHVGRLRDTTVRASCSVSRLLEALRAASSTF